MTSAIEIDGLQFQRGNFSLEVPMLRIEQGTVVGLIGSNGAGKSTLLELLIGLHAPKAGAMRVAGLDVAREAVAVRRRTGFVQPESPLFALRVDSLLRTVAPFYPSWDAALAAQLVTRFALPLDKHISQLSRGEGLRVRLVLALAYKPEVVLLDEPTSGLDVANRREVLGEIVRTVSDAGRTVVVASHDLADLERICDRIVWLDRGRVVADGTPAEVAGVGHTLEERLLGGV